MAPMKVKNGIESSRSLEMMPYTRNGKACKNEGSKWPVLIPRTPKKSPTAASEKATGNPTNMKTIIVPNISGGNMPYANIDRCRFDWKGYCNGVSYRVSTS